MRIRADAMNLANPYAASRRPGCRRPTRPLDQQPEDQPQDTTVRAISLTDCTAYRPSTATPGHTVTPTPILGRTTRPPSRKSAELNRSQVTQRPVDRPPPEPRRPNTLGSCRRESVTIRSKSGLSAAPDSSGYSEQAQHPIPPGSEQAQHPIPPVSEQAQPRFLQVLRASAAPIPPGAQSKGGERARAVVGARASWTGVPSPPAPGPDRRRGRCWCWSPSWGSACSPGAAARRRPARPGPARARCCWCPGYGGSQAALTRLAARLTAAGRTAKVVALPGDGTGDLLGQADALDDAGPGAR